MELANLESREVLLAKLAGAMKGSLAKAARVFDALRIKMEAGAPVVAAAAAAPVEAVVVEEAAAVETEVATDATPVVEEVTPESEEKE